MTSSSTRMLGTISYEYLGFVSLHLSQPCFDGGMQTMCSIKVSSSRYNLDGRATHHGRDKKEVMMSSLRHPRASTVPTCD